MTSALETANPVTRLLVSFAIAVVLVLSVDVVSAGVALVLGVLLLLAARVDGRGLLRRSIPILVAAPFAALTLALYGTPSGAEVLRWGFVRVTEGSLLLGAATGLRVLAIGVCGVGLLAGIDATRLADGLAQLLRLPPRFVLGALAAFRLLGLLGEDWRALALARRARGVADSGRLRRVGGQAFGLLVLSLRRAGVLATAMEARGFGGAGPRTWARPSRLGAPDAVLALLTAAVLAAAVVASVASGAWHPVGGPGA